MTLRFFFSFACMAAASAVHAHHGWSSYDERKALSVTGTIIEVAYIYPHASIRLKGAERTWLAILAPPARMVSRGLPGDSLRVGDTVTVEGYASRRGPNEVRAERLVIGGRTVELR